MTIQEYDNVMNVFHSLLMDDDDLDFDKWQDKVSQFQSEYMHNVIKNYNADTKAKEKILDILTYAVEQSESGNSIRDVDTEEEVNEIDEIIWEEIGDYLLDYETYQNSDGTWAIDCMFAGNYVPYWDGWLD